MCESCKTGKLVCDVRVGCVAIYPESRIHDSPGLNEHQERIIAYSSKGAVYKDSHWQMDQEVIDIYTKMVDLYNKSLDSIPEPVEKERTCGNCKYHFEDHEDSICWSCMDGSLWKPRTEGKDL